jgi:hypothetical protein
MSVMMEAASTSETSVKFYQTTRRSNTEDGRFALKVLQEFAYKAFVYRSCQPMDPNTVPVLFMRTRFSSIQFFLSTFSICTQFVHISFSERLKLRYD